METLPWLDLERQLWSQTPEQWAHRVKACASENLANIHLLCLMRFATGTQVRQFFTACRSQGFQSSFLASWIHRCESQIPELFKAGSVVRSTANERGPILLRHFHRPERTSKRSMGRRRLVVGISGDAGMLMMPSVLASEALAALNSDLLLIRRNIRASYVSDQGTHLSTIRDLLEEVIVKHHYTDWVLLGTSGGGLAAVLLGLSLPGCRAVSLNGSVTASQLNTAQEWLESHQASGGRDQGMGTTLLVTSAGSRLDVQAALELQGWLGLHGPPSTRVMTRSYPCNDHLLFEGLQEQGWSLPDIFRHLLSHSCHPLIPPIPCSGLH